MDSVTEAVEYRDVEGFPGYRVGDDGSVWSRWKWQIRPRQLGEWRKLTCTRQHGYLRVTLCGEFGRRNFQVHHLVLESFVGPRPAGMEACHNDGDRTNARLDNLRWDTSAANEADKRRHGTAPIGEANAAAKLTDHQVLEIREAVKDYRHGLLVSLAKKYGVSRFVIYSIRNRKLWTHI